MSNNNKSNNQYILHDAIHGTIDLRFGLKQDDYEKLYEILNCSFLNRLRNIKQLGFASHSHPSADHSRHAHAIGTMHIMNFLFSRVIESDEFKAISDDVEKCFSIKGTTEIKKHLLLAGLLQDIGELPFAQATQGLIKPNQDTIKNVYNDIGDGDRELDDKDIFTIGAIFHSDIKKHLDELNINLLFLVFLITGHESKDAKVKATECRALLHMVDGDVDADRLDYVFRDGHHTYGYAGNPNLVISSLECYDKDGPVFNDPGPISEYFLKRGHLWTTVYLAPENRFKNILLKTVLKEYFRSTSIPANEHLKSQMSLEEFKYFDDIKLFYELNKIQFNHVAVGALTERGRKTLEILLQPKEKYEWFWLPSVSAAKEIQNTELPLDVFYDTFSNYREHNLFSSKHIRIRAAKYEKLGEPLFLEDCSGAFGSLSNTVWVTLPKKNCILIFTPVKKGSGKAWSNFTEAFNNNSLYELIYFNENGKPESVPYDTWDNSEFKGKRIFISYAFLDRNEVNKIVFWLHKMKRKYRLVRDLEQGTGTTTSQNSIRGIEEGEAIIMIASTNYIERYNNGGNVSREINAMIRLQKKPFPLPIDSFDKLTTLPWEDLQLGKDATANDIRGLKVEDYEKFVKTVLSEIDSRNAAK
jgi:HD superfamily phosphohydrolase